MQTHVVRCWPAVACLALLGLSSRGWAQVDARRADEYFREAAVLCGRDAGHLWGVSLCGPMVFADAASGTAATNEPSPAESRPGVVGFANTSVQWGDTRWASFVWGLLSAEDAGERDRLMLHELFHRIQPELGLAVAAVAPADHLDTLEGRFWLRLEWRALARAIQTPPLRQVALGDALTFRAARQALFKDAAEIERSQEINEGLAQYTGTVLAAATPEQAFASAAQQLARAEEQASFVSTFAYASGVGYGVLLDAAAPGWTRRVQAKSDLARMLADATGLRAGSDSDSAAARYGGPELRTVEERRATELAARLAELRRRFVDGPVLILPWGRRAVFDTRGATPIPGEGVVYQGYRVADEWGRFEASGGVLVSSEARRLVVPRPKDPTGAELSGDGWHLALSAGWVVRPAERPGDLRVVRDRP